jgi:hypothetical protein
MNRLAAAVSLASFCFAPIARAADLACDTPGIAQMIIPDLFTHNPSAQKLGLEVSKVTVLSIQETTDGPCRGAYQPSVDLSLPFQDGC